MDNWWEMLQLSNSFNTNGHVKDCNEHRMTGMWDLVLSYEEMPKSRVQRLAQWLGMSTRKVRMWVNEAVSTRQSVIGDNFKFIFCWEQKFTTKYTLALIEDLDNWLFTQTDFVIASPKAKDVKTVKNRRTGTKTKEQKYFYVTSIAELLLEMAKPVAEGGFNGPRDENGVLLMSDTMVRNILPPNLSKLTNSYMELWL